MARNNVLTRSRIKKASVLLQNGKFSEARSLLAQICAIDKTNPEPWVLLSAACGQLGLINEAIDACQQVIKLQPDHLGALINLGNAMMATKQYEQAIPYYQRALKQDAGNPDIANTLGNALYLSGKTEQAAEYFQQAIKLRHNFSHAYYNLANSQLALGQPDNAVLNFQHSLKHSPGFLEACMDLANLLRSLGRYNEADDYFHKALEIQPDCYKALSGLATSARFQGDLEQALAIHRQILERTPHDADALAGEADILERLGSIEESSVRVKEAIGQGSESAALAEIYLRICRLDDKCDDAVALSHRILSQQSISASERQSLHYALGKLHDKLGNFDNAFEHYEQANELSPFRFDLAEFTEQIDKLISYFGSDNLSHLPRAKNKSQRPVFIVGMPRSGTSLVEQIVSSHPQVFGAGELNQIRLLISQLSSISETDRIYPECLNSITEESATIAAQQYLGFINNLAPKALRITDKLPHNFIHLGLISILFPKARIIHCVRDARDTCLSIYFQSFNWMHPYSNNLEHLGAYYLQYERLMKHWGAVIDIPILEIQYEQLVKDQERTSRNMIEFCGLEWDDCCLQFYTSGRKTATASYDQVRQPVYTQSVSRWKNYETHISPLLKALSR